MAVESAFRDRLAVAREQRDRDDEALELYDSGRYPEGFALSVPAERIPWLVRALERRGYRLIDA